jgi:hypothetical protein
MDGADQRKVGVRQYIAATRQDDPHDAVAFVALGGSGHVLTRCGKIAHALAEMFWAFGGRGCAAR